jgi:hypothetical protein
MPDDVEYEVFRAVHRITERRGGAVYKTEFVEKRWVPMGLHRDPDDPDLIYVSISTSDPDIHTLPRRKRG